MTDRSPRESLIAAANLLRLRRAAEAMPLLDHALTDQRLSFAPMVQKYARLMMDGHDTAEVRYEDRSFRFSLGAENLGLEIHHAGGQFFETAELSAIRQLVPRRAVLVDVGANVGNHLVFFAAMLQPLLVIPVEPVPSAISALRRNLALNELSVDERGLGVAAGREAGWLAIELDAMRDLVEARVGAAASDEQPGNVRSVPLDDLIPERVDFLKIDVEGFEANVIAGAQRILTEDKPLLMVEAHDDKREALLSQLAPLHYKPIAAYPGIGYQNLILRVQVR